MEAAAISSRLIAKVVLVAAAVVVSLYVLWLIRDVIGLLLIAAFFALAIAPGVNWLQERRVPRPIAILMIYLAIGAGIFGIGLAVVPPMVNGVENLSDDAPGYLDDLRHNEQFRKYDDRYDITQKLQDQAADLPSNLGTAAGTLQDVTVGVFSKFVELFAILVITFFLLMEGGKMLAFAYAQLSGERERRLRLVAQDVSDAISGYVFGNCVISVLAGGVTYVTLSLLDIPFAVPLAILFAFFDLIPLVGATLGGILVGIVVAFAGTFPADLLVWTAVLLGYQQVENYLVQPYVYGKAVKVHPLTVIIAILIGAELLGILGALIAIPVAASLQSVIRDAWMFRQESRDTSGKPKPRARAKPKPKPA